MRLERRNVLVKGATALEKLRDLLRTHAWEALNQHHAHVLPQESWVRLTWRLLGRIEEWRRDVAIRSENKRGHIGRGEEVRRATSSTNRACLDEVENVARNTQKIV